MWYSNNAHVYVWMSLHNSLMSHPISYVNELSSIVVLFYPLTLQVIHVTPHQHIEEEEEGNRIVK